MGPVAARGGLPVGFAGHGGDKWLRWSGAALNLRRGWRLRLEDDWGARISRRREEKAQK